MGNVKLPKKFVSKYPHKFSKGKQQFLRGKRILPKPITGKEALPDLIDNTFLAYNAGRLQEAKGSLGGGDLEKALLALVPMEHRPRFEQQGGGLIDRTAHHRFSIDFHRNPMRKISCACVSADARA